MTSPGRILAVDYGDVRTGLALSDPEGIIVQPLEPVVLKDPLELAERVTEIAMENDASKIVVGLPLLMSGKEGARVEKTRKFMETLRNLVSVPVIEWDERLSSKEADEILREGGLDWRKRKKRRDAVAAVLILRSYLQANLDC